MCYQKKSVLLLTVLIILSASQSVQLENNLRNPRQKYGNCLDWNGILCKQCQEGFYLINRQCSKDNNEGKVDDNFVPCNGQLNCANLSGFKSQYELEDYIAQTRAQRRVLKQIIQEQKQNFQMSTDVSQVFPQYRVSAQNIGSTTSSPAETTTSSGVVNIFQSEILKTDGKYIYIISGNKLSIIEAYPHNSIKLLSNFEISEFSPSALFVQDQYLVVIGTKIGERRRDYHYQTAVRVYNIEDRLNPIEVKRIQIVGSYVNGIKTTDGYVYLITGYNIFNKRVVPWYRINGYRYDFPFSSVFYYPEQKSDFVVSIFSLNLRNLDSSQRGLVSIIIDYTSNFYMTERAIYIAFSNVFKYETHSLIYKIFVKKNQIIPFADARINGVIDNSLSMNQYDQVLRVVTTSTFFSLSSNVFRLDFFMDKIGELNGIAPKEDFSSIRFSGYKLYLATFRGYLVISLEKHRTPKLLGRLKLPRFSKYLHPYDENTVIGIGSQSVIKGEQLGLKISLFNISDVANPQEISSFQLQERYASSTASWEDKSFLFSKEKNLLVVKAWINSDDVKLNGALTFYVDSSTILLRGIVNHILDGNQNVKFYKRHIKRSLFIEELLYTKSECLLKVNRIQDLVEIKTLNLAC